MNTGTIIGGFLLLVIGGCILISCAKWALGKIWDKAGLPQGWWGGERE